MHLCHRRKGKHHQWKMGNNEARATRHLQKISAVKLQKGGEMLFFIARLLLRCFAVARLTGESLARLEAVSIRGNIYFVCTNTAEIAEPCSPVSQRRAKVKQRKSVPSQRRRKWPNICHHLRSGKNVAGIKEEAFQRPGPFIHPFLKAHGLCTRRILTAFLNFKSAKPLWTDLGLLLLDLFTAHMFLKSRDGNWGLCY